MLDLKAKLLAAGLVTKEQVEKVEREENMAPHERAEAERWKKRVAELAAAGKAEQYEAIRGWVERARLDQKKAISEAATRFNFAKADGSITWISLEPDVHEMVASGQAGIIAYMSNSGLAHAVVPRDIAVDVQAIRPEWLRVLNSPGGAGC